MELLRSIANNISEQEEIEKLNEVNILKRGLGHAAGRVGGQLGKQFAARVSGQHQSDQKIKQLKIDFSKYVGQIGKKVKTSSAVDLADFFKSKNLPVAQEIKRLGKQQLNQTNSAVINKAFQVAVQGGATRQMRQGKQQPTNQQPTNQQPTNQQGSPVDMTFKKFISSLTPAQKSYIASAV